MNRVLDDLKDSHTHLMTEKIAEDFKITFKLAENNYPGLINKELFIYLYDEDIKIAGKEDKSLDSFNGYGENLLAKDINKDLAYIKIRSMLSPGSKEFDHDLDLLKSYLKKSKGKDALIIDIRGNGGGNSAYTNLYLYPMLLGSRDYKYPKEVLLYRSAGVFKYDPQYPSLKKGIKKLSKKDLSRLKSNINFLKDDPDLMKDIEENFSYIIRPERKSQAKLSFDIGKTLYEDIKNDTYRFKGRLYLLIDEGVYSSAERAAQFFKLNKLGKIIGQDTRGDGIGTSPAMVRLPNTGYILTMSQQLGLKDANTRKKTTYTEPDIKIEDIKLGYGLSNDKCIKKVLEIESSYK